MIILGLGSNLGDRLGNMRRALHHIQQLPGTTVTRVSPVYLSDALLPNNSPTAWDMSYLNAAIRCETTLSPHAFLDCLKRIEQNIGRHQRSDRWSPRPIDIDILVWDDIKLSDDKLTIPHPHLLDRPFALWPLADLAPFWLCQGKTAAQLVEPLGSRYTGEAPFHTRQINQRIDTPELVGIINATPDSFTDGGQFLETDRAMQQAMSLVFAGASILDIGAESTSPTATPITAEEEWARLEPVLEAIQSFKQTLFLPPKMSVDTRHADVAAKALAYQVDWINDVSGLDDPAMRHVIASSTCDCVIMHHLSIPERRDNVMSRQQNPVNAVLEWGMRRLDELEKQGIARERLIFDPGIGFGKMAEQSLALIQNVAIFAQLGVRILVGHSRKTYLSLLTSEPPSERDIETTAVSLYLSKQPIHYLRLHNIAMCARAFRVDMLL